MNENSPMKIVNDMLEINRGFAGTYTMSKLSKNKSPLVH